MVGKKKVGVLKDIGKKGDYGKMEGIDEKTVKLILDKIENKK